MTENLYKVRLYMKSGNVIELVNLKSFNFKQDGIGKKLNWEHHPEDNTFTLLGGGTLDLDQIEAVTSRTQEGFIPFSE
jgi:hypothetical protein